MVVIMKWHPNSSGCCKIGRRKSLIYHKRIKLNLSQKYPNVFTNELRVRNHSALTSKPRESNHIALQIKLGGVVIVHSLDTFCSQNDLTS